MKREEAKDFLPIIQAFAEGKEIEYYDDEDGWVTGECFNFDSEPENYRIKVEPKYRLFKDCDELIQFWDKHYENDNRPKGTMPSIWVKSKDTARILPVFGFDQKYNSIKIEEYWYNSIDLYKDFTFLDGTPCGIEVTE